MSGLAYNWKWRYYE